MAEQPAMITTRRRSPLRRLGCGIALILWFAFLLTPCFLILLATQREIAIQLGDVPGQSFRIWLIDEARQRGVAVSRPLLYPGESQDSVCLQTSVTFILWMGSAEPATFCDCYVRSQSNTVWEFSGTTQGSCTSG